MDDRGHETPVRDEPEVPYWVIDLDEDHLADVLVSVGIALRPTPTLGPALAWGVVSEEEGGIVAYAMSDEIARLIVKALNALAPHEHVPVVRSENDPKGDYPYLVEVMRCQTCGERLDGAA
jgi:hypothetical protein